MDSFPETFNDTFYSRPFNRRLVTYVLIIFFSLLTETDRETIEELNIALRNERTRAEQIQQAFTNEKRQTEALKHVKEQSDQLRSINKGYLLKAVFRWRVNWVAVVSKCTMGMFLDAFVSFIGCSEMARETASKFVSRNRPIVQLDTTSTQSLS